MRATLRLLVAAVLTSVVVAPLSAQSDTATATDDPLVALMKRVAPGEHHLHLARMSGDWKAAGKIWLVPGQPPVETAGTMHSEPILGGRFMKSEYTGSLQGLALLGLELDGYDTVKNKHVGLWIDNQSTWIQTFEGTCSEDGDVTTTTGHYTDPATGKEMSVRTVLTFVEPDKMVVETWVKADSDPEYAKSMEITYTR